MNVNFNVSIKQRRKNRSCWYQGGKAIWLKKLLKGRFHDKSLLWIRMRSLNMSITPHVEIILGSSACCLLQPYYTYLSGKSSQEYIWSIFEGAHSITLSILCSWEVFGQYANGVSEGWEALINRPTQPVRGGFLHCICWQSSLLIFFLIHIYPVDNICWKSYWGDFHRPPWHLSVVSRWFSCHCSPS